MAGNLNIQYHESKLSPTSRHEARAQTKKFLFFLQKSDEDFETTAKNVVQVLTTNDVTVAHNQVQVSELRHQDLSMPQLITTLEIAVWILGLVQVLG